MSRCINKNSRNTNCSSVEVPSVATHKCEPFQVCLGLGRTLEYDGLCFHTEDVGRIQDGWYSSVKVVGGCIVDVRADPLPEYTPPPCAPIPGGSGGGVGGEVRVSQDARNLTRKTSGGDLLTTINTRDTSGVTIKGNGTQDNPLTVAIDLEVPPVFLGGSTSVDVVGEGSMTDPYKISLPKKLDGGIFAGFTVSDEGIITSYTEPPPERVRSITDGRGITATDNAGVYRLDINTIDDVAGNYALGAFNIQFDDTGRIARADRIITLAEGTYKVGEHFITANQFGSIERIDEDPDRYNAKPTVFVMEFPADPTALLDGGREFIIDLPYNGSIMIEYFGTLASRVIQTTNPPKDIIPGWKRLGVGGARMYVGDVAVRDIITEVSYGYTYQSTTRKDMEFLVAARGVFHQELPKGTHSITVFGPSDGNIGFNTGMIKVTYVGDGL